MTTSEEEATRSLRDQLRRYGIRTSKTVASATLEESVFLESSPPPLQDGRGGEEENGTARWSTTCLYCEKDYLWQLDEAGKRVRLRAFSVLALLADAEGYLPKDDAYLVRPGSSSSRVRLCNSASCCNPFHRTWNPSREKANRFEQALQEHSVRCASRGIPDQGSFKEAGGGTKRKQLETVHEDFSTGTFTVFVGKVGRNMNVYLTDDISDSATAMVKLVIVPVCCDDRFDDDDNGNKKGSERPPWRVFKDEEFIGSKARSSVSAAAADDEAVRPLQVKRLEEEDVFAVRLPVCMVYHSLEQTGEERQRIRCLDMAGTLREAGGRAGVLAAVQEAVLAAFF